MHKKITETTQQGIYVCYLFSDDMETVYLTLAQGVTKPIQEMGRKSGYGYLQKVVYYLRNQLPLDNLIKNDDIALTSSGLGQDYQVSTIAYVKYEKQNIPPNDVLIDDLENIMKNYELYVDSIEVRERGTSMKEEMSEKELIEQIKKYIKSKGFSYPDTLIENYYLSLKTKPFVILAGISGTGKTKLVQLFAESVGATRENGQFTLIPVRPDWSDPSDLIGYTDLTNTFRPGSLTTVLREASKIENKHKPYFICFDEMNLARVEHYFSDLLSIIETKRWRNDEIITDPIININNDSLVETNVTITENVYLIGTVNMDETTHPFSKKVLDRANTIEFNYINLGDIPVQSIEDEKQSSLTVSNDFLRSDYLFLVDVLQHKEVVNSVTNKLIEINAILEDINANIGFRVRDAISFYMIYNHRFNLIKESVAFDYQILQKILPRIQGSSVSVKRVLIQLMFLCIDERKDLEAMVDDASELYLPWRVASKEPNALYPYSAKKIAYMLRRLEEDGFTSFWIS